MRASWCIPLLGCALAVSSNNVPGQKGPSGVSLPVRRTRASQPQNLSGHVLDSDVSVATSHEFSYLVTLNVGTEEFEVTLDTGSADLWVVSNNCTVSDCKGITKYAQNSSSSSLVMTDTPFKLNYLIGSVTGFVATETVTLGPYQISAQTLALANETTALGLSSTSTSGILGLAFPATASIKSTTGTPLAQNLLGIALDGGNNTAIPDPHQRFFAYKLGRDPAHTTTNDTDASYSSFTIGGLDPRIVDTATGKWSWSNVSSAGMRDGEYDYWKLPLHGITIDTQALPLSPSLVRGVSNHTPVAVLDTGTTLILGPSEDVEAFWNVVGSSRKRDDGIWEVACERGVRVGFVLGDGDGTEYVVAPEDVSWMEGGSAGGWCMGGIQANDGVNSADWLLGDVFLRNVYVSHHSPLPSHPPTIGLLPLTDPTSSLASFHKARGPDQSSTAPSTAAVLANRIRANAQVRTVCSISGAGGFLVGVVGSICFVRWKGRRNRARKSTGRRGRISI